MTWINFDNFISATCILCWHTENYKFAFRYEKWLSKLHALTTGRLCLQNSLATAHSFRPKYDVKWTIWTVSAELWVLWTCTPACMSDRQYLCHQTFNETGRIRYRIPFNTHCLETRISNKLLACISEPKRCKLVLPIQFPVWMVFYFQSQCWQKTESFKTQTTMCKAWQTHTNNTNICAYPQFAYFLMNESMETQGTLLMLIITECLRK